tara:strand:- start:1434 stop:1541 length:108 start_codon:yes stop_codon:yes gene_type:complete
MGKFKVTEMVLFLLKKEFVKKIPKVIRIKLIKILV